MIEIIVSALIYILPAYVANSSAVLFGGGKPIDLGKSLHEERILGNGKTIRGFLCGGLLGSLTGLGIYFLYPNYSTAFLGILLSFGALTGDIVASFLKRRVKIKRGAPVPILDQLDFVIGAVAFASIVKSPSGSILLFIFLFTPLIHFLTNFIGYMLGFKENPW